MNDVLPDEAALWERFEDAARAVFAQYGYRNLRVPIVEQTPLFVRGIGDATDIVEHEMYTFEDKLNGESLTLRPEATAGIVRAAIEHIAHLRAAAARVDRRPDVSPRAPAEGPLSAVPPARRRGARLRGTRRRRRADRHARAAVARARPRRRHPAADQLDRRCRRATRASRRPRRLFRAHMPTLLDDDAKRRLQHEPAADPRLARIPAMQEIVARRAEARRAALAARRARISTACSAARATAASRTRSTRGSCAASTTTTGRCSSGSPTGSARRARSPAADATTACSSSSAASRRPRAASRSASSG